MKVERVGRRKPNWIKIKVPGGKVYTNVKKVINERGLHTVCMEARCPNMGECFEKGTATFLILGDTCTRNCRYCAITKGEPQPVDKKEPEQVAEAAALLNLRFVVLTSVTRDDLSDGGAALFAETVQRVKEKTPHAAVEVLIPDFGTVMEHSLETVINAGPGVINHNIEVVERYYSDLRPMGDYGLSLRLLEKAAGTGILTKSGLMIGFGENIADIELTLSHLLDRGCRAVTIGQYCQSGKDRYPVEKYYTPAEFETIREMAEDMGFDHVLSGPQVRSSYHADLIAV
ncbi:MAG: lipoyl synthase [bacterium]|nr:lipoyl synthase [bacterium]